jgi:hypothetical protein
MPRPPAPASRPFFDRLLRLSSQAESVGNYATAYHLLMAALHQADFLADLDLVRQVSSLAAEQEGRLEAVEPPHHLASAAAQRRGVQPLYRGLQVHTDALRARLTHRPEFLRV